MCKIKHYLKHENKVNEMYYYIVRPIDVKQ